MAMPAALSIHDIIIRLIFTIVAGMLIGTNRTLRGRPAGLRTTTLVALAASLAMIQANALLATYGKPADAFAVADVLRLPLGILSGIGFIGAGTILHKGDLVTGLTTATCLWLATVLGLCFGGGQLMIGSLGTGLGCAVLWGFKLIEKRAPRDRTATLRVDAAEFKQEDLRLRLKAAGFRIRSMSITSTGNQHRSLWWEVEWRGHLGNLEPPAIVAGLNEDPGIESFEWRETTSAP
jgi:putative Mg2+ transporter-C (MgtC) family protein